jgi:pimeloyl-ACP methyl ester carboxylesterase
MIVQIGLSVNAMATPTTAHSPSITLPDGRRLAYREAGDPSGRPVLFCHGWMASRLTAHPDDALTASLGARVITADRPGIGASDPDPRASLLSVAADLQALADALELDRFAVVGHSGGGPYALALAHRAADRVTRVAIAAGFAPFDRPGAYAGMTPRMRGFARLLRAAPWLAGPFLRSAPRRFRADAEKAFAQQFGELCPADQRALADPATHANLLAAATEALAQGSAGVAGEARTLFGRPWGFPPSEVRCPVALWYGTDDTLVPPQMGEYLHAAIAGSSLTVLPGEGHTLYVAHWAELLGA